MHPMELEVPYRGLYRNAQRLGRVSLALCLLPFFIPSDLGRGGLPLWIAAIFGVSTLCGWIDAGLCVDLRRMGGRDWWKPLLWGLPGVLLTPLVIPPFLNAL